jgi:hypothetical protein
LHDLLSFADEMGGIFGKHLELPPAEFPAAVIASSNVIGTLATPLMQIK